MGVLRIALWRPRWPPLVQAGQPHPLAPSSLPQKQDNKYVCCSRCQQDVVGLYFASTASPGYCLCFRCYGAEAGGAPR